MASSEKAGWRLVSSRPLDGPSNMAIDDAIFEAVELNQVPATLRISSWTPGFLSIGADQPWEIVNEAGCKENGWDVVRRSTVGRAILQADGLSFSFCLPTTDPRALGDDSERFSRISKSFIAALKGMGLDPDRSRPFYGDFGPQGLAFYDGPSEYEVNVGSQKLVCGAIRSSADAVLIQSTVLLSGEIRRIADALRFKMLGERLALIARLGYRAATLQSLLGYRMEDEEASVRFRDGFAKGLNITFTEEDLTGSEASRAAILSQEKYSSDRWTKGLNPIDF